MYLSDGFALFPFPGCPFSPLKNVCDGLFPPEICDLPSDTLVIFLVKGVLNDH